MSRTANPAAPQPVYPGVVPLMELFGPRGKGYEACKRSIDVLASLFLLVVLMPLSAAIVALVRASGPGPILFKQRRLGRGGKPFWCYKFRSMVPDAESRLALGSELGSRFHKNYKIKDDPRVTRVGAVLRRTSLDELPQLWNVLRGDMSLVGPRPESAERTKHYSDWQRQRLKVHGGVTGLAQVHGLREQHSSEEKARFDLQYIFTWSPLLDLSLILQTA